MVTFLLDSAEACFFFFFFGWARSQDLWSLFQDVGLYLQHLRSLVVACRIKVPDQGLIPRPLHQFSSVQSLSNVQLFATPWTAAFQASLSITNSWSLLKLMSIKSVMPSNHLILCHTLLHPHSIFASIRVFSNESVLPMRWPKYWSFSFNISPSNEYSGLISFRMDCLDLLAVQGILKSLLQPQFKNINSFALSPLYSSTLTSILDYWKNHSLD